MRITEGPRGILQIDNARIVYRNFAGEEGKYNRKGDRNFAVVIPDEEMAERLTDLGWNVKVKPPRDEDDSPFMFLKVKVQFNERGPKVYLKTGTNMVLLDEESVDCLDHIDIANVDLDLRPYHWDVNGKQGISAYLQSICVTQEFDRFASRHEEEYPFE